jgi:hypothetical protein
MMYTDHPHASIDFNHSPHSAIVDGGQTRLSGDRLLNLLVWFDNEWGFANRMIDVADFLGAAHVPLSGLQDARRAPFAGGTVKLPSAVQSTACRSARDGH